MSDLIEIHEQGQDCDCHSCAIAERDRLRKALEAYENPKNWTRPFDCDGKLINQHALYLPKIYAAEKR